MKQSRHYLLLAALAGVLAGCGGEPAAPPTQGAANAPGATAPAEANLDELLAQADVKRGQTLFLQCRACHSLKPGEPHKVGPNLTGMFGRQVGAAEGFAYSDALQAADFVWDDETLDAWLARPSEFLPGNRMVFVGIRKPQDRANLIAYVRQETE